MPVEALQDPLTFRYYDYPRPGSIYRLPDIRSLVRGPTFVKLPSGKDIQVPPQMKNDVAVPAQVHENEQGKVGIQERKTRPKECSWLQNRRSVRSTGPNAPPTPA